MILFPAMEKGWIPGISHIVSPNQDERPAPATTSLIVVHAISLPPAQFGSDDITRLFTNTLDPATHPYFVTINHLKVSAHFLIRRDGEATQFVSCDKRAWHAGLSCWRDRERCNDFSIGIELEGCDDLPFEDAQYECLQGMIRRLQQHYPIEALTGHSDIAPGRKTDPGPFFQWHRLSLPGIPPRWTPATA